MKPCLSLIVGLFLLAGCTTPPVSYYYGNYSRTLYHYKKDNTPASLAKHRHTLEEIIQTSEKKGIRVPPGIYCEYAYMLAREGNPAADNYYNLEVKTYPESERFVSFVRAQSKNPSSQ
jgi:hypothetical protein